MSLPRAELAGASRDLVAHALHALGGTATRGDLIMATALPRAEVDAALDALLAAGQAEVAVSESAVVVYRLQRGADLHLPTCRVDAPGTFDRKTLQLIRARGGVVSLAELVEHTGLTVERAHREAERLADLYGGESHASLDDHTVYAFPDLVESAHGAFHVREPRPAWARVDDPMDSAAGNRAPSHWLLAGLGAVGAGILAWLFTFPPEAGGRILLLAGVAGASAGGAFAMTYSALRTLGRHPRLRLRRTETVRRYTLGYVFETALRGKGVVSLERTMAYLEARAGGGRVARRRVERALRQLADEFDAPLTELEGDLFFGFRNVKRQFLASRLQRIRMRLERQAAGKTIFDSGDSELSAARRELEDFDRALLEPPAGSDLQPGPDPG